MKNYKALGFAFIALAGSFLVMGMNTQKAFIAIAVAFLFTGISFLAKSKRAGN